MSNFFISIYNFFEKRRVLFFTMLAVLCLTLGYFAAKVSFNENISSFFGQNEESDTNVFDNIKLKDRITILVSADSPDTMIEAGEAYMDSLQCLVDEGLLVSVTRGADETSVGRSVEFIYEYLPIFLEESDYQRLEAGLDAEAIDSAMGRIYSLLVSPSGMVMRDVLLRDPLSVGTHLMRRFERFGEDIDYELYAGHIFSSGMDMMLMFAEPAYGMGSTGENARLVRVMESLAAQVGTAVGAEIACVGGPVVAVYNANQIKHDVAVTMSFALLIIVVVILLSFRDRRTIPLMILPPFFGALFSMAAVYFFKGGMSAIAIGAGAVVLGIALSYSIHVISHSNHVHDPRQIIRDLAGPLTIGSLTTIGAFAALMFTDSPLLQDLGLFSVFALIGTVLFCLIFLPHLLSKRRKTDGRPLLRYIERINAVPCENNRWALAFIAVLTVVCMFFYKDVQFDSDLNNINYMPQHIAEAEDRLMENFGDSQSGVPVACSSSNLEDASDAYYELDSMLVDLCSQGVISNYVSVRDFVIPPSLQRERIDRWNSFWRDRREEVLANVTASEAKYGFRQGTFRGFAQMLESEYGICNYDAETISGIPALSDWINPTEDGIVFLGRIGLPDENKAGVYSRIDRVEGTCVIDRAYFSSMMITETSNDFDFILLVSSVIVFLALLISYGRLELALMTFLPMFISWIIILGFMAILDIRFNIVNIILATFIFGIGDDFSIFIMDGLLGEYRTGKKTLAGHKTAIFFSAFTTIVGMGAMLFARNPALKSIAVISVLGLGIVVLVSYVVQPFLFRILISRPAAKGGYPYTIASLLRSLYVFFYFFIGSLLAQLYAVILMVVPVRRKKKDAAFYSMLHGFSRLFLATLPSVKTRRLNPYGEEFKTPAVIIANHQSLADVMLVMSVCPKVVILTNKWVWNSPVFGQVVRRAGFYCVDEGYQVLLPKLKARMQDGYSILVFPEGSRSRDCSVMRFHKGAFLLARELGADILPMVLYGTGKVCEKERPFYIKSGTMVIKTMQRTPYGEHSAQSLMELPRMFRAFFREQYSILEKEYQKATSKYVREAIILNYIYKGPVLEWYMRFKTRMDGYYALWDELVPRNAVVTDVGCGYGQLSFTLGLLSRDRRIYGLDYDREKILLASASLLNRDNLSFICDDMTLCDFPQSDVFLFNDSLHYVSEAQQIDVLERSLKALNAGGCLIVRDADSSDVQGQEKVERIEKWSTGIIKFNKTSQKLTFTSRGMIETFAGRHGLELEIRKCSEKTSETLYIIKKLDYGRQI